MIASLRSPILLAALAGCIATPPVHAHGDVTPQAVDVSTLRKLSDNWLDENPYRKDQEAERVGASAYNQNCARCHGLEAISGGIAPDLRKLDIDKETDQYYAASVRRGKVRNGAVYMPPFEGILSQEAVWAIKAYLETRREPEDEGPMNPMEQLAKTSSCLSCHGVDNRMVGPAYREIAKRYERDKNAEAKLLRKVKKGGVGAWGKVPMPPMNAIPEKDLRALVKWILAGAR